MNIDKRISSCRERMKEHGLDAYIIPTNDPHQSEYVAEHWKSRQWVSGFTGSAGVVVITSDHAGLWTDSRYFIQAEEELSTSSMVLHKIKLQHVPEFVEWIIQSLPKKSRVGIDGWLLSKGQHDQYKKLLDDAGVTLVTDCDIISEIWEERPSLPGHNIFIHEVKYCGSPVQEKIAVIREEMKAKGADHYLITALDEIAWLLNLRGKDVEFNPVFIAYAIVGMNTTTLYIDNVKVPPQVQKYLVENNITTKPYDSVIADLNHIKEQDRVLAPASQVNTILFKAINGTAINGESIIKQRKAIKNDVEISHIRQVMKRDGAALANAFYWLEKTLEKRTVSEVEFSAMIAQCREDQGKYFGESFGAIIGYNSNGAIVHYRPQPEKCAMIKGEGILLADSGGQYLDGTTDITRTIALGEPTQEQKKNFTLVLKGHIALAQARFPKGTTGQQLDTFARQYLWDAGLDYGHGTGHGVGFFLNVHEGPQGFAPNLSERGKTAHLPGMYTSNEPGFYKVGEYGIRTENLVIAREDKTKGFIDFETVTLYPIDIKLIDETHISNSEKTWLNRYHAKVFEEISPLLSVEVKSWFKLKCRPLN